MTSTLRSVAERLRRTNGVLVDSNVLLDVATDDVTWSKWSSNALAECLEHSRLFVNPIIYAEVSVGFFHHRSVGRRTA